jgi:hypothetical protein
MVLHSVFMIPLFMVVVEILEMIIGIDLGGTSKGFISDHHHHSSKCCSLNKSKSIS